MGQLPPAHSHLRFQHTTPQVHTAAREFDDWQLRSRARGSYQQVELLRMLWEAAPKTAGPDPAGMLPLHIAAGHGSAMAVQFLLTVSDAASVDSKGRTAAHHAAAEGRGALLSLLLGAAPQTAFAVSHEGPTPLALAATHCCSVPAVRLLLQAAPDTAMIAGPGGWVPAHHAAVSETLTAAPILRLLLAVAPQCAAAPTAEQDTPLHLAAARGNLDSAVALLAAAPQETALALNHQGLNPVSVHIKWGQAATGCKLCGLPQPGTSCTPEQRPLQLHMAGLAATDCSAVTLIADAFGPPWVPARLSRHAAGHAAAHSGPCHSISPHITA